MKKFNISLLVFSLFLTTKLCGQPSSNSSDATSAIPGFIKSYFSITAILEAVEESFITLISKEEKKQVISKAKLIRNEMVTLREIKAGMYNCSISPPCRNINRKIKSMRQSFTRLNTRLHELDSLYGRRYSDRITSIKDNLTTELDRKRKKMEMVVMDLYGTQQISNATMQQQQKQTLALADSCIFQMTRIITKMKLH
ncbi:hypothetical protein [Chitinophaga pinensis]|uniref:Uncharacterized protein n=1 Tax=Chitinophaga pinensis (strain ATCC 43595 / DSM 2588 / LMG 13176 / NBRC 15968 / NCIMB 11800 / UQM 2034) TaxID=485918 RepID=A0A979GYW7_CHIPD|nr:hypothetical protein [Chitinophaga pinensis]ACU62090.1 hypothetical protein Cpin_4651 [Chitinophaga pinensis DSM 2588]